MFNELVIKRLVHWCTLLIKLVHWIERHFELSSGNLKKIYNLNNFYKKKILAKFLKFIDSVSFCGCTFNLVKLRFKKAFREV